MQQCNGLDLCADVDIESNTLDDPSDMHGYGNTFSRENIQRTLPPSSPVYRRPKDSSGSSLATYSVSKQRHPRYPVFGIRISLKSFNPSLLFHVLLKIIFITFAFKLLFFALSRIIKDVIYPAVLRVFSPTFHLWLLIPDVD